MKHRTAVILVGVLAVCTCPWILTNDSSAAGLDLFVKIYTAFFGPIFAVLITDYYILHRGKMEGALWMTSTMITEPIQESTGQPSLQRQWAR